MTKKNRRSFFLLSLTIFMAVLTVGYLLWNKPHKNVRDAAAAAKVAATDLYNLFITDSLKAKNLYIEKIVLVWGQVEKISVNQQLQDIILLKTGVSGAYINCTMENKTEGVREHESVSIKGICSGYINGDTDMGLPGDVFLIRGYLLK